MPIRRFMRKSAAPKLSMLVPDCSAANFSPDSVSTVTPVRVDSLSSWSPVVANTFNVPSAAELLQNCNQRRAVEITARAGF
ncbi:MAG: hypothetical protein IH899_10515 [Planctomycetes bacterium]|nr:hypothetical protein [Planctomycetota bacterium]